MEELVRLEYELSQLQSNELNFNVDFFKNKKDYIIDITFPQQLIDKSVFNDNIKFTLYINGEKYPISPPRLYCTTQFCFPSIADGRDILEEVLNTNWDESSKLIDILPLLKDFISNYLTKNEIFIGHYYLGELYDMRILKKLSCIIKPVKENIIINGKWAKLQRTLIVSDIYFLLFEQSKINKNKYILIFWAPINSILQIKKILINKAIFIHFKQNYTYDPYEMCLSIEKGEEIVELLLQRMQYFGMIYNISKQNVISAIHNEKENKESTLLTSGDEIDINKLLEDIKNTEDLLKEKGESKELKKKLFSLYIHAEKYYGEQVDTVNAEIYKKKRESIKI